MTLLAMLAATLAWAATIPSSPLPSLPTAALFGVANFRPVAREVDNWRREGALALDLSPDGMAGLMTDEAPRVARCVKLNNYWCIKRAGWAGEIASDGEGHVAFASAREGAAVAALLLRRYYMDFGLHSARAIISRWAPAECGLVARGGGSRIVSATLGGGLARKGLGGTLRARWLATHTVAGWTKPGAAAPRVAGGGTKARVAARPAPVARRSVVPDLVGPLLATPTIMAGPGAPTREPMRLAMLPYPGMAMGPAPGADTKILSSLPPVRSCSDDGVRIANYAAKTAAGVVAGSDTDLELFDKDGQPTPNLAKVMANMASVEIGPLRASDELVAAGIAVLRARK